MTPTRDYREFTFAAKNRWRVMPRRHRYPACLLLCAQKLQRCDALNGDASVTPSEIAEARIQLRSEKPALAVARRAWLRYRRGKERHDVGVKNLRRRLRSVDNCFVHSTFVLVKECLL